MKIYSALQIGEYHLNHCDDYLVISEIGSDKIMCAVMDGCTMATESYFASTLVGKLLKKIAKEKGYKELYNPAGPAIGLDDYLRSILADLFRELNITKSHLLLERNELLTTLIILLIDKKTLNGVALVVGDGVININGEVTEFDQDNRPDYLGYHLTENFETWYNKQEQKVFFNDVKDICIATDGILTFTKVSASALEKKIDAMEFMIHDRAGDDKDDMLELKLKKLEHFYGLKPADDIGMVRIID